MRKCWECGNEAEFQRGDLCFACWEEIIGTPAVPKQPKADPGKSQRYNHTRNQFAKNYPVFRQRIDEIKDTPCVDCGRSFPPECMDFDHVRGVKTNNVGSMNNYSLERLLAEIDKCDIVCSNCHRTRTKQRRNPERGDD